MVLVKAIAVSLSICVALDVARGEEAASPADEQRAPTTQPMSVAGVLEKREGRELSINTPDRGLVTVAVDQNASIQIGPYPIRIDDLKPGMKVRVTSTINVGSGRPQFLVRAAEADDDHVGTIVRVEEGAIIVRVYLSNGAAKGAQRPIDSGDSSPAASVHVFQAVKEVRYPIDSRTGLHSLTGPIRRDALRPGALVHVYAGKGPAGQTVQVLRNDDHYMFGTVVRVEANTIMLYGPSTAIDDIPLETGDGTEFLVDAAPGRLEDIKAGMLISATRIPAGAAGRPKLMVKATSPGLKGTIVRIDGTHIVIDAMKPGGGIQKGMIIDTDAKTSVVFPGPEQPTHHFTPPVIGSLSDLKPGETVTVQPETGVATRIIGTARGSGSSTRP